MKLRRTRPPARLLVPLGALVLLLPLAACGGGDDDAAADGTLTVVTHDSWAMDESVLAEFERESGLTLEIQPQGDAGSLTNQLVLTKDNPIADGVYGIDNTFGSRAVDEGVVAPFRGDVPAAAAAYDLEGADGRLVPIDYSDVCVNVDTTWFEREGLEPPATLDDLLDPAYRDLMVVPGAATSSPGLAFLLATIAAEGDDWPTYWERLVDNGVKVVPGWSDAYEVDFTAGGGSGDRPIVVSYSSSPPFTVPEGGGEPTTAALLDTCFRQVEYAGVVEGGDDPEGMQRFVEFMLQREFQRALPTQMYVYPVTDVRLPQDWAAYAEPASDPYQVDPAEVAANRDDWVREWRDLVSR